MLAAAITIAPFLAKVDRYVLNPIITLLFAIALLVFFYGIVTFINSGTTDKAREDGKKKIIYGLIGMFVMFSAYGLVRLIIATVPGLQSNTGLINFGNH